MPRKKQTDETTSDVAVNSEKENIKIMNDLIFPKKMKIKLSNPIITLCIFIITIIIVVSFSLTAYGIYYIAQYGIDSTLFYDEKHNSKDDAIVAYQNELSEYKAMLDSYSKELEEYKKTAADQSQKIDELIEKLNNSSSKSKRKESVSDNNISKANPFKIYYYSSYEDVVNELIKYCNLTDDKNIELVAYTDADNTDFSDADLILCETNQKSINDLELLSAKEIGLTNKELKNTYSFAKNANSADTISYVVCPGYIQIRADLANKYFKTTDPDEIYKEYFCDFDTMSDTANMIYTNSKGKVSLFASLDEVKLMYDYALAEADITYDEFCEFTEASIYTDAMWGDEWFTSIKGTDRKKTAMAAVSTTWFSEWILNDSKFADNNSILVKAPVDFYWGGESVAATKNCSNPELAKLLITTLIADDDFNITINNSFDTGFLNNSSANASKDFVFDLDSIIYDDQDYIAFINSILK